MDEAQVCSLKRKKETPFFCTISVSHFYYFFCITSLFCSLLSNVKRIRKKKNPEDLPIFHFPRTFSCLFFPKVSFFSSLSKKKKKSTTTTKFSRYVTASKNDSSSILRRLSVKIITTIIIPCNFTVDCALPKNTTSLAFRFVQRRSGQS